MAVRVAEFDPPLPSMRLADLLKLTFELGVIGLNGLRESDDCTEDLLIRNRIVTHETRSIASRSAGRCCFAASRPRSSRRRIASAFDGISGCLRRQSSIFESCTFASRICWGSKSSRTLGIQTICTIFHVLTIVLCRLSVIKQYRLYCESGPRWCWSTVRGLTTIDYIGVDNGYAYPYRAPLWVRTHHI